MSETPKGESSEASSEFPADPQAIVDAAVELFSRELDLSVPRDQFPTFVLQPKRESPGWSANDRTIRVSAAEEIRDGKVLGEETFHFLRSHFCPKRTLFRKRRGSRGVHEHNVSEFYGWLGRKVLYGLTEDQGASPFFPDGPPRLESREHIGDLLRGIRGIRRRMHNYLGSSERRGQQADPSEDEARDRESTNTLLELDEMQWEWRRRHLLEHHRGYRFADNVDLGRIKNWRKFLSLPDREVRQRFFTDAPDYTGLEQ